ncbi:hypothetical protein BPAE_0072g00270 [Botrytis paeoniae]|uniref:Uncharacterized protein n=1 Tax=Botrytis paeoniae TaxID=278948 RepID=A0A4Z1FVN1_9HELO|nr:hypothetical protein BPAE_0072g00270 [Botrytis paeoniae]
MKGTRLSWISWKARRLWVSLVYYAAARTAVPLPYTSFVLDCHGNAHFINVSLAMLDRPTNHSQFPWQEIIHGHTVCLQALVNAMFSSVGCTKSSLSSIKPFGVLDSTHSSRLVWSSTFNFRKKLSFQWQQTKPSKKF